MSRSCSRMRRANPSSRARRRSSIDAARWVDGAMVSLRHLMSSVWVVKSQEGTMSARRGKETEGLENWGDLRPGMARSTWASFQATRSARFVRWGSCSKLVLMKDWSVPENSWSDRMDVISMGSADRPRCIAFATDRRQSGYVPLHIAACWAQEHSQAGILLEHLAPSSSWQPKHTFPSVWTSVEGAEATLSRGSLSPLPWIPISTSRWDQFPTHCPGFQSKAPLSLGLPFPVARSIHPLPTESPPTPRRRADPAPSSPRDRTTR